MNNNPETSLNMNLRMPDDSFDFAKRTRESFEALKKWRSEMPQVWYGNTVLDAAMEIIDSQHYVIYGTRLAQPVKRPLSERIRIAANNLPHGPRRTELLNVADELETIEKEKKA